MNNWYNIGKYSIINLIKPWKSHKSKGSETDMNYDQYDK